MEYISLQVVQEAFIVDGLRTPVGKAPRGALRHVRADDLAALVIKALMERNHLQPEDIDDVIVGCAVPEAEQGLQMGRLISLLALDSERVPGMIVNRYCASGLEAIAIAVERIRAGWADCIIAGGAESMSQVPMAGWRVAPNPTLVNNHPDYFLNMGLTAEELAEQYGITREEADQFAYSSHMKAVKAQQEGRFDSELVPVRVREVIFEEGKRVEKETVLEKDEGPRPDTSVEKLAQLPPVFKKGGVVTAGNSSQRSDGAAFVVVMSERKLKEKGLTAVARLRAVTWAGVPPRIMGIGPVYAIPKALRLAGIKLEDVDIFEINEAFAVQVLAVLRNLSIPQEKLNVNGGAIALGHPLGCTGCKLTVQIINELKRRAGRWAVVSACVGGGQGIAGVIELV